MIKDQKKDSDAKLLIDNDLSPQPNEFLNNYPGSAHSIEKNQGVQSSGNNQT